MENKKMNSTSGANIKPIGFFRLRVIELIKTIFESHNEETIDSDFNFLSIMKSCIADNKWNNITQNMIVKTFHQYLKKFYKKFKN